MKNLESLERETPEFQSLTPNQQNERRHFLSLVMDEIIKDPSALGITQKEAGVLIFDLLEFHLTGKIERREEKPKIKKP